MKRSSALLLAALTLAGCSGTMSSVSAGTSPTAGPSAAVASAAGARKRSQADVDFMSGMIPHHAQAVLIAGWARSHGARLDVAVLCDRIVVGQRDEIALMQRWLKDRGEDVPAADATHHRMKMNGMTMDMLMPGMLNAQQLAELDKARGTDFDRLFLQAMIGHHAGAITMVDELFGSVGAADDDVVYRFASDVYADQTTEIDRMQKIMATLSANGRP